MADEINVFLDSINGSTEQIECDATNDDQRILRLNILQKMVKFLKDPCHEYSLSAVLQFVREEYEENVFCQELLALVEEEYIEIRSVDAQRDTNVSDTAMPLDASAAKQLIEEGEYDKILIALKEQQSGLLLHSFVDVNIVMLEMKSQLNKVKEEFERQREIIEQYDQKQQAISNINSEFQQKYKIFEEILCVYDSKQKDLEGQIREARNALTEQAGREYEEFAQTLDEKQKDIEDSAVNKAEETIEREIKSAGKIGQAMQDAQKSIIQYLAIFVAIFALVNINVVNAAKWSYADLFRVNVIMTTSMTTLVTLVHIFTDKERKWLRQMLILLAVLWIALAVSALNIK